MATVQLNAKGLKCPVPVLKMTQMLMKQEVKPGDIMEVLADCPTFEADVKTWCQNSKKVLMWIRDESGVKRCQIQI